ncbi:type II toxin-antitoxin system HipA family toxin [Hyphococcus luteus]|uniref:Type II toxin-antitoxin system HipA family toxin n=1 Tax=Hyphococcus luteus TaxID=2058213 RepID=A0A2S7K0G8_9PROT|nr:type II toxin-antitoxin system HipA family toxin [Marinicaulis flavus]PQA86015.1 type II toxin-antitoxin system HipA family toxin [Marinicaulis flavus]
MTGELIVLLGGNEIGRVTQDKRARMKFIYDDKWQNTRGAYPLSLSMPLAASEHDHAVIDAFIWGLLPDNEFVLSKWAQKFQVSARNSFALISQVGEDCAGAVQFVQPERLEAIQNAGPGSIEWIDETEIAERLKALRADHSAWRRPRDTGQFSLAGAQPKTALLYQNKRWGIPSGRMPTTHILKPPTGEFDGHAENEHFCLMLARALGLPTVSSSVMHFDGEPAIVVERYDRQFTDDGLVRIHQEDMCQALGIPPTQKYENEDGPGVARIVDLLREVSGEAKEDVATFIDAIAFNWLIAGTDAHAKNYSLLIGAAGRARLAPLYDLASALPYDEFDPMKLKLAMKLGGKYRLRDIYARQWTKLADEIRLKSDDILNRIKTITESLPDVAASTQQDMKDAGLKHPVIDRLAERLTARAEECLRKL